MIEKNIHVYAGWRGKIFILCRASRQNFLLCRLAGKNIHFMQDGKEKYSFYAGWQGKIFILCRMARKNIYFMQNRKHIDFQVGCQGRILMLTLGGQEK